MNGKRAAAEDLPAPAAKRQAGQVCAAPEAFVLDLSRLTGVSGSEYRVWMICLVCPEAGASAHVILFFHFQDWKW